MPATDVVTARKPSRVDEVSTAVLKMIRDGQMRVGDALPSEGALALKLGVSRIAVREATRALATLGVIEVANGRSPRVTAPAPNMLMSLVGHAVQIQHANVRQVLDARRVLETRTVVLAALRRSDEEARTLVALAAAMRRDIGQPEQCMEHDIAIHKVIAEAAQNPFFALFVGSFEEVMRSTWPIAWRARATDVSRMQSIQTHEAIAAAIAAGDAGAAERQMTTHFDQSQQALGTAGVV